MADRGRDERRQWGHTTDPTAGLGPGRGAAGAPGTTGAFRTSDPLGAPGSTGAGLTHHDPSFIPGIGGATYLDPDVDYGGQQQQHRHPTSGAEFGGRGDSDGGRRQHGGGGAYTSIPSAGVGGGKHQPTSDVGFGDKDKLETSDVGRGDKGKFEGEGGGDQAGMTGFTATATAPGPGGVVYGRQTRAKGLGSEATGERGGGKHQPTSDVGFGDEGKFETYDVGRGDKGKFEGEGGGDQAGMTGFSTTTTATGPSGVVYARQTRAVGLGSGATGERGGGNESGDREHHEKKGLTEKAKDFAERIPGVGGRHHPSSE